MYIPPFHKGQEVVAIANHSQNAFKKDQEFVVYSCWKGCCSWMVLIGIKKPKGCRNTCPNCYRRLQYETDEWIFFADLFRAKQTTDFQEVTYSEVLEKEKHLISVN